MKKSINKFNVTLLVAVFSIIITYAISMITIRAEGTQGNGSIVLKEIRQINKNEWEISSNLNLNGQVIKLPHGCSLRICEGAYIYNGEIIGNNSRLNIRKGSRYFRNIKFSGIWSVPVVDSGWFVFGDDEKQNSRNFESICSLTSEKVNNTIKIRAGVYPVMIDSYGGAVLNLKSNTILDLAGTIELAPNGLTNYGIITLRNVTNINITGKGGIIGDVRTHIGNKGEWGMGILIANSHNISVKDISVSDCWGDCIYIGQSKKEAHDFSSKIVINNVTCRNGRRQGLSLIAGENVLIKNCKFLNTGDSRSTPPAAGIDIEPNSDDAVVKKVIIDNCVFSGNVNGKYGDILLCRTNKNSDIIVQNCYLPEGITVMQNAFGLNLKKCTISNFRNHNKDMDIDEMIIGNKIESMN